MEQNAEDAKIFIDADIVINKYNEANPDKRQLDRKWLAEILGVKPQLFSDWKSDKKKPPKWAKQVLQLCELIGCETPGFIIEEKKDV